VGGVEQVSRNALLDLRPPSLHLGAREVLVTVIHRLELAAVDRDAGFRQQAHAATERDKTGADLPDGAAVVLAEVGNRLVIRSKSASEPHHLDVPPGLMLEPAARLNPIEVAVDVKLEQYRRMVRRPAGRLRIDPVEPKLAEIEFFDKNVDHPNRIVLVNPVFKALGKKRALPSIRPLNEALHTILRRSCGNHTMRITSGSSVFTQPGSIADSCSAAKHGYSITSSAVARSVGGESRPSAFAVLRLTTRLYLVGACTGSSAGFSPFNIRST